MEFRKIITVASTFQRGDAYVRRYLEKSDFEYDDRALKILNDRTLTSEEKEAKLVDVVKEMIAEVPDDQVDIREVEWSEVVVDQRDIYKVVRDHEDLYPESVKAGSKKTAVEREYKLSSEELVVASKKLATVTHRKDGWYVLDHNGKSKGGPYSSEKQAKERLKQVEMFKHMNASSNDPESTLMEILGLQPEEILAK